MFDYQRVDGGPWFRFRDRKGVEVNTAVPLFNLLLSKRPIIYDIVKLPTCRWNNKMSGKWNAHRSSLNGDAVIQQMPPLRERVDTQTADEHIWCLMTRCVSNKYKIKVVFNLKYCRNMNNKH